jgi:hypothetical protein
VRDGCGLALRAKLLERDALPVEERHELLGSVGMHDGAWTALGRPCLPGPYFEIRCVPWVMAAPARSAAATNVVSASSASVAPALSASSLWISMQ